MVRPYGSSPAKVAIVEPSAARRDTLPAADRGRPRSLTQSDRVTVSTSTSATFSRPTRFATAVVSWVSADPRNPIVRFLRSATDPLLRIIRRMLPTNLRYFPIDIAFLVLLAIVLFSQFAIAQTLIDIGVRLRRPVVMEPV